MRKGLNSFIYIFAVVVLLCQLPFLALAQEPTNGDITNGDVEYAKDSSTEINVKDADIAAIIKIFAKKTKRNFILDERVKGQSINLPSPVKFLLRNQYVF